MSSACTACTFVSAPPDVSDPGATVLWKGSRGTPRNMARAITILHTADWHLGHTLVDVPREAEHAAFLEWLLERIERERPDALVHAGDVFDSSNPPAAAQRAWYGFLA